MKTIGLCGMVSINFEKGKGSDLLRKVNKNHASATPCQINTHAVLKPGRRRENTLGVFKRGGRLACAKGVAQMPCMQNMFSLWNL